MSMNIIKSGEWELLSNFVRNEELNTVKFVLDFLTEETLRYENGEASYPRIDFAIAIALDRRSEERRNQERLALKMSVPSQPQPQPKKTEPVLKLSARTVPPPVQTTVPVVTNVPEPTTPVLSPKLQREMIRKSWIMKFERDAQKEPEQKVEVKEPEKKEAEKKEPEKKEKIVKQESESESESEPEPPKPVKPVVKRIIRRRPIKKAEPEPESESESESEPEPEPPKPVKKVVQKRR